MKPKFLAAAICAGVTLVVGILLFNGLVGYNDSQNWQVWQSVRGRLEVVDGSGWYGNWFGRVWTYPRTLEATYERPHKDDRDMRDESIGVTFNDGGMAQVSSYVRVQLPTTAEKRLQLHRDFQGNPDNIVNAVYAHLRNAIKASGPVMSASENQASRKAEFNQIVEDQLSHGLFKMRRTTTTLDDLTEIDVATDASGNKTTREKKATVQATEIVHDPAGKPIVIQPSPLLHYDLPILQFSISDIDYDQQTLAQFAAKKDSYLNAERSKAQRQEEVQSRLMIEEKGRRQVAEIEAEENQKKTRALIQAQQAQEVAVINKDRAVTEARQKVEVAGQYKGEAETLQEIAKIKAATAELDKKATIAAAEGHQKQIELAGGVTERDRVLAQIAADRDIQVAVAFARVAVPATVINGGGPNGASGLDSLIQVWLLKQTGVVKDTQAKDSQPEWRVSK